MGNRTLTEKENLLRVLRGEKGEWIPEFNRACDFRLCTAVLDRAPGNEDGYDSYGVHWTWDPRTGQPTPTPGRKRLADVRRWREEGVLPDLDKADWAGAAARDLGGIDRERKALLMMAPFGVFERLHCLMGFEDALCAFYEEPEAAKALADAIADLRVRTFDRVMPVYKPDLVLYFDDWGNEGDLFFSPAIFEEFLRPATQRIVDAIHRNGALAVLHSDGKIQDLVPAVVEMGWDAWHPAQPCNDVAALRARYRDRLAFVYGLENQKVTDREGVTEAEIRAEVRAAIDRYASGGRFAISPISVKSEPWKLDAISDEVAAYGFGK